MLLWPLGHATADEGTHPGQQRRHHVLREFQSGFLTGIPEERQEQRGQASAVLGEELPHEVTALLGKHATDHLGAMIEPSITEQIPG